VRTYVISYKEAPFTAAVISCDAAEEQLQEKQLSAAGVISCDAAVGQLLEKTLDEMLELEPGENVSDLIQGGAHNSCGDQL
jgi:hypothetical protein